jgi:hypothetical protein
VIAFSERGFLSASYILYSVTGVPPHGKNQKQVEPSPAHPQFSKNLNLDKKNFQFFWAVARP